MLPHHRQLARSPQAKQQKDNSEGYRRYRTAAEPGAAMRQANGLGRFGHATILASSTG
jgi:hypothetical protein